MDDHTRSSPAEAGPPNESRAEREAHGNGSARADDLDTFELLDLGALPVFDVEPVEPPADHELHFEPRPLTWYGRRVARVLNDGIYSLERGRNAPDVLDTVIAELLALADVPTIERPGP